MARKTEKTREQYYREMLEGKGIRWQDCKLLSFVFEREGMPDIFHYELMGRKVEYFLFDGWGKHANVVVPGERDEVMDIAKEIGGEIIKTQ